MKCKDCIANNGNEICSIGKKCRMLVCGHYGCDLQGKVIKKRMGVITLTNADIIRSMTDEEMAEFIAQQRFCAINPIADKFGIDTTVAFIKCKENVLGWLKQEVNNE